jgi:two-component sensor histidine kinase
VFVVNELVTNSIEHGTGTARLLTWATDHTGVPNHQRGPTAQPDGRPATRPVRNSRGRGLLSVNLVADLVRIHTTRNRTAIRVHFDYGASHPAT